MAFTEVPLQPAKKQVAQDPAAPIAGVAPAQRPALTAAELAAKERADKIARKKASKAKVPVEPASEASPVEIVDPPDPMAKATRKRRQKKARKPKAAKTAKQPKAPRAKTGVKMRMVVVGLPVAIVLGGAGTFAYMNKERFGFGSSDPEAAVATGVAEAAVPAGGSAAPSSGGSRIEDDPILGSNPFEAFAPPAPQVEQPPIQVDEPPAPLVFSAKELQEIVKDPRRTLEAFLLAGSPDDLIHFVTDREQVEDEIRAYYSDGKRIPIATRGIKEEGSKIIPGTSFSAYMYWVTSNRRRIPVSVEQTAEGYRVDWAAFTQFHDAKFEKFMRDPTSPPGEFYVQMRRSHFFGNNVPDLDELQAFRVGSPIAPFPDSYAFLRRSNPEASAILERYRWSVDYLPVVELKWEKPEGGEPRIELQRVVRHAWRR